jgi:hypothetical protein
MLRFMLTPAAYLGAVFLLVGCQTTVDAPLPAGSGGAEAEESAEVAPEFIPERREGGTARENQPHVDWVVEKAIKTSNARLPGLEVVDRLVDAGYSLDLMELTPDMSLIKLPVDSTTVAIRFDQECVLVQWGEDWYASSVEPVVAGGTCLLGETVSLD